MTWEGVGVCGKKGTDDKVSEHALKVQGEYKRAYRLRIGRLDGWVYRTARGQWRVARNGAEVNTVNVIQGKGMVAGKFQYWGEGKRNSSGKRRW